MITGSCKWTMNRAGRMPAPLDGSWRGTGTSSHALIPVNGALVNCAFVRTPVILVAQFVQAADT